MATLPPKAWKKLEKAQAEWPQWVAALTGKLGTKAGADGEAVVVLENPALQVFEKKAKMEQLTPTWHQEALERGIDYIILVYHKADGFVFCPSHLVQPFRVEGDYDGSVPIDAVGALAYYERMLAPHNRKRSPDFTERVSWFVEFLQKILRHEDFSLDDLQLNRRTVEIRQEPWPW